MKATELRSNLYRILDRVLDTGQPVTIERKGRTVLLVPGSPPKKLSRLVRRDSYLTCDPEDVVHLDWSDQWKP